MSKSAQAFQKEREKTGMSDSEIIEANHLDDEYQHEQHEKDKAYIKAEKESIHIDDVHALIDWPAIIKNRENDSK